MIPPTYSFSTSSQLSNLPQPSPLKKQSCSLKTGSKTLILPHLNSMASLKMNNRSPSLSWKATVVEIGCLSCLKIPTNTSQLIKPMIASRYAWTKLKIKSSSDKTLIDNSQLCLTQRSKTRMEETRRWWEASMRDAYRATSTMGGKIRQIKDWQRNVQYTCSEEESNHSCRQTLCFDTAADWRTSSASDHYFYGWYLYLSLKMLWTVILLILLLLSLTSLRPSSFSLMN